MGIPYGGLMLVSGVMSAAMGGFDVGLGAGLAGLGVAAVVLSAVSLKQWRAKQQSTPVTAAIAGALAQRRRKGACSVTVSASLQLHCYRLRPACQRAAPLLNCMKVLNMFDVLDTAVIGWQWRQAGAAAVPLALLFALSIADPHPQIHLPRAVCHATGVSIAAAVISWQRLQAGVVVVPSGVAFALSVAMALFATYNMLAGGNPPKREKPAVSELVGEPLPHVG
jgi:hypothetical protein